MPDPSKAKLPIVSKPCPKVTVANCLQFSNARSPIVFTLSEKETEVNLSPLNIAAGNSSICAWKSSFPLKPVLAKAFSPIVVTDAGITRSPVIAAHL